MPRTRHSLCNYPINNYMEQQNQHINPENDKKKEGKQEPIKLSPEELERRKETGYKTDEEARRTPDGKEKK